MSKKYLKWVFGTNIANKENEKFSLFFLRKNV